MKNPFVTSVAILVMLAGTASASLIVGELGFLGSFETNTGNLATATALEFPTDVEVDQATGDFVIIPSLLGDVTFKDFEFWPSLDPDPVPLWNKGGFSFDMTSVSIDFQNSSFLLLSGTGTLMHLDFMDTPGLFTFSGTGSSGIFQFAAVNVSDNAGTPEPTSVLVWGGLIAVGLVVKRRSLS